ncbi:MAG TPA: dihydroneopterin aldolase [Aliidiomarina sp.]|nr:dihydroneopterin aldolase [Aliidiomarina sp.]
MDTVSIVGLKIDATIGIFDWEQEILQPLVLELNMRWDNAKAAKSGSINDALDYAAVSAAVIELVKSRAWGLIEEVAEAVAASILKNFNVPGLNVKVEKPTAIASATSVGVSIVRGAY